MEKKRNRHGDFRLNSGVFVYDEHDSLSDGEQPWKTNNTGGLSASTSY